MQISSASLLAAQQARTQTPVQPRAAAQTQAAGADEFEPLLFAAKPGTSATAKPNAATAQPQASPAPFARPGSQLDIKI